MVQHLTYLCRLSYNITANESRLSRTPGNRIAYLYTQKVGKAPSLHVVCALANFKELELRDLKF